MKRKLFLLIIAVLTVSAPARADYGFTESADFTGEAFFTSPTYVAPAPKKPTETKHTTPPLKVLRLKLQERRHQEEAKTFEYAPTAADLYAAETKTSVETSEYASQELEEDFADMESSGQDAQEYKNSEASKQKKHSLKKKKGSANAEEVVEKSENIILDCDNIDYDTPNYLILATGNVSVNFVKQGSTVKADKITFDRMNNTIKAEGNVKILKSGRVIVGDYIFVDMNEENALIENPITNSSTIEMKAKKGYVYGDKIVQEQGEASISGSYPLNFASATKGPRMSRMLVPKTESLTDDLEKGTVKFKVHEIKITQKGDLEIISLKRARLLKGKRTIIKKPAVKIYTNKNHDYAETGSAELGSYRGMGMYFGPGIVFELPKGSVLKAMPILNYKSGFGVGGIGRFSSGTNQTLLAYGTATHKWIGYGKQELDDNLFLQYGMNSYLNEWFLGRRRPKYGISLVYQKGYSSDNFLVKNHNATYEHRLEAGYFHDLDFDTNFEKLSGSQMGTTRFRYMAQARQNLFNYRNENELKAFGVDISSQLSTSLYGTGDTQVIGRIGPNVHMQYKRWMQEIGYYFSVYRDDSPMPVFDAYRYGKQNLYVREYFRICRYLTLSWFGSLNLSNDSPNGKDFQENTFYISVGPDDVKFNIGYDFVRENTYFTVELMMDAKGAKVEYDTLEIKQVKKPKEETKEAKATVYTAPDKPQLLQKAVVENVKVIEDVL